ncbi:hypothetical protein [Cohnella sp. REN36]|uniref:hypothetical protein n=1 Tax=Cohnella sp. REN36 TaxID=2887347 RepID=UPI001D13A231|nr:hypothetical protein [Cohnella sp. REN36]MCC3377305.1 hypothetical protein [Cohnella sp. REN36]
MSRLSREWEVKLSMLGAIAKSQDAMARILDAVADVAGSGGATPAGVREHVRVLSGLQAAMLGSVTGVTWQPPKRGKPAAPWVARGAACRFKRERESEGDWDGRD